MRLARRFAVLAAAAVLCGCQTTITASTVPIGPPQPINLAPLQQGQELVIRRTK